MSKSLIKNGLLCTILCLSIIFSQPSMALADGGASFDEAVVLTQRDMPIPFICSGTYKYFKFIPAESTTYTIRSSNDSFDSVAELYDQGLACLAVSDDYTSVAFNISQSLNAGQTYYLEIGAWQDGSDSFVISGGDLLGVGTLAFANVTDSVSEATATKTLTVNRTGGSDGTVTVDYAVTGGTATGSGVDYTLANGTLTFGNGVTSQDITVNLTNDSIYEANETVVVTLSNAQGGASIGANSSETLTITDNDAVPGTLAFANAGESVSEGTATKTLTVNRTGGSDGTVTVDYTVTGTATGGGVDYTLADGTLAFGNGATSQDITINITNDSIDESNETIVITLSNAQGGADIGANSSETLTIVDNDVVPGTLAFANAAESVSEATATKTLTVNRTGGSDGTVTVDYAVTDGTAIGGGVDYTLADGTLTFGDGVTSQDITVGIVPDGTYEANETIVMTLSNAQGGASIGATSSETLTITDNDAVPGTLAFANATDSVSEATATKTLTVNRTGGSDGTVTVDYTVTGTATGGGVDYTLADGTLAFGNGVTSQDITLSIVDDGTYESNETVVVTLSNAQGGAGIGATSLETLTITDNDAVPGTLAFANAAESVSEATATKTLTVNRTGGSDGTVTVDYAVTGGTATAGGVDYTLAGGTLTFGSGVTSQDITVGVVNDGTYEANETVIVTLSNAQGGASIGATSSQTLTIIDNDSVPGTLAFANTAESVSEASATKTLTVNRTGGSDGAVTVDYAVTGGTATAGGVDYTLASGTLTFGDAVTSQAITVNLTNDSIYEANETVIVTLSNAQGGASIGANSSETLTINDDDASVACDLISVEAPSNAIIDGTIITANVPNESASLVVDATVSLNATWNLYSDDSCTNEIADKMIALSVGANIAYIKVAAQDGTTIKTYTLNINRASASSSNRNSSRPTPASTNAEVIVNGEVENIGTVNTTEAGEKNITTVVLDEQLVEDKLENEGSNVVVTIAVNTEADVVVGELNGQFVSSMEDKQAVVELKTETTTYTLPVQQLNIESVSKELGVAVELKDIKVKIQISKPTEEKVKVIENSAKKGEFTIVVSPVEFAVKCTYENKTVEVKNFNAYVERTIAIPEGVEHTKITTGVVIEPDGTVRHVPTKIIGVDGKYYAKINSLTNSSYLVIWHPVEFNDVENHWAKEAVNDMGSRMVISGVGDEMFEPGRDITRAEFAAIIVRALGLQPGAGENPFGDVQPEDWYSEFIETAYEYDIISGYENGKFAPNEKITREQAMTMIDRAARITGQNYEDSNEALEKILSEFSDAKNSADWAVESVAKCVKAGIVSGRTDQTLAPKDNITRAEVAVIIKRLLQNLDLI